MAENDDVAPAPKKSKLKLIIIVVLVAILAIGLSVAGTIWFMRDSSNADDVADNNEATPAEEVFQASQYFVFDKPLVATLKSGGRQRYIQVYLALEADQAESLAAAEKHLPLVRSRLLGVLSGQAFATLQTVEGRDQLISDMLETVNKTLEGEGEPPVIHVLFRNFVLQ